MVAYEKHWEHEVGQHATENLRFLEIYSPHPSFRTRPHLAVATSG